MTINAMKLITGMHRSGTSLVARLVWKAGADFGDPETFYPGDEWNVEGYYEQPDVHSVNMPLVNGPWGRLSYIKLPSPRTVLRRARRRADAIRELAQKYKDATLKDPRFCLTLPAWLQYGARVDGVLICLRDPISVATSLWRRNRLPLRLGYHLWQVHITRLLSNLKELRFSLVYYPNLLQRDSFDAELTSALSFLGIGISPAQRNQLFASCVRPQLDHSRCTEVNYPPRVGELWQELLQQHSQGLKENSLVTADG